jgi:hypothetical protein
MIDVGFQTRTISASHFSALAEPIVSEKILRHGVEPPSSLSSGKAPWWFRHLGTFTGVAAAILCVGFAFWVFPERVSPFVVLLVVAPFVLLFHFLNSTLERLLESRAGEGAPAFTPPTTLKIIFYVALGLGMALAIAAVALAMTSLYWGSPLDLRRYLAPELVSREEHSFPAKLEPHFGNVQLVSYTAPPGGSVTDETRESMEVWKKWLSQVSEYGDTEKLLVFDSPQSAKYFEKFDGKFTFPGAKGRFRLADGVAYLSSRDKDTNNPVLRQLEWYIPDSNMQTDNPAEMQDNQLTGVRIDGGDSWFVVAHFAAAGDEPLPGIDAFKASLVEFRTENTAPTEVH